MGRGQQQSTVKGESSCVRVSWGRMEISTVLKLSAFVRNACLAKQIQHRAFAGF